MKNSYLLFLLLIFSTLFIILNVLLVSYVQAGFYSTGLATASSVGKINNDGILDTKFLKLKKASGEKMSDFLEKQRELNNYTKSLWNETLFIGNQSEKILYVRNKYDNTTMVTEEKSVYDLCKAGGGFTCYTFSDSKAVFEEGKDYYIKLTSPYVFDLCPAGQVSVEGKCVDITKRAEGTLKEGEQLTSLEGKCGDGVLNNINEHGVKESCDDSNYISGDGCSRFCLLEDDSIDSDNDGVPDYIELEDGTDPNDPKSKKDYEKEDYEKEDLGTCGDNKVQVLNKYGVHEQCDSSEGCGINCKCITNFTLDNVNKCIPNTSEAECANLPFKAKWWNSSIKQTWNESKKDWSPVITPEYKKNQPSTSDKCYFSCEENYNYISETNTCEANKQEKKCEFTADSVIKKLPKNAEWISGNKVIQSWDGYNWSPSNIASYNKLEGPCNYACKERFEMTDTNECVIEFGRCGDNVVQTGLNFDNFVEECDLGPDGGLGCSKDCKIVSTDYECTYGGTQQGTECLIDAKLETGEVQCNKPFVNDNSQKNRNHVKYNYPKKELILEEEFNLDGNGVFAFISTGYRTNGGKLFYWEGNDCKTSKEYEYKLIECISDDGSNKSDWELPEEGFQDMYLSLRAACGKKDAKDETYDWGITNRTVSHTIRYQATLRDVKNKSYDESTEEYDVKTESNEEEASSSPPNVSNSELSTE